ncbi:MAG: tetratricopeptide repeat protein, partial [Flavobacteriales bacterium]
MGTEQVDALIQRAKGLSAADPDTAMRLLDDAVASARRMDYRRGIALALRERAAVHLSMQHFKRALTGFTEALEFFKQLEEVPAMISCHNEISGIYFKLGDCAPALEHVLSNLQLHTAQGDSHGIADCYNDIGNIYSYLQSFDKATEHYKKALRIFEGLKNKREMLHCFYLLANTFRS